MSSQPDRGPSRRFMVPRETHGRDGGEGMVSVPASREFGRNDKSGDGRLGRGSDPGRRKAPRAGHRDAQSGDHRGQRASRRVREGPQSPHPELPRSTHESSREAGEMAPRSPSEQLHRGAERCRGQATAQPRRTDDLGCRGGTRGCDDRGADIDPHRSGGGSPRCIHDTAGRPSLRSRV